MIDKNFDKENPILGDGIDEDDEFFDNEEEECPLASTLISLTLLPKPFGMTWESSKIEKFLKGRGYRILNRHDDDLDEDYKVAIRPGETVVPEQGNLVDTFTSEVQNVLLDWMLSLNKKEN